MGARARGAAPKRALGTALLEGGQPSWQPQPRGRPVCPGEGWQRPSVKDRRSALPTGGLSLSLPLPHTPVAQQEMGSLWRAGSFSPHPHPQLFLPQCCDMGLLPGREIQPQAQSQFGALCRASPLPLVTLLLSARWAQTELPTQMSPLPSQAGNAAVLTSSSWQSCQFLSTEQKSWERFW